MDSANSAQLFRNSPDDILMPNISDEEAQSSSQLISDSIQDVITQETVKTLILPEKTEIADKNFVFDFSDAESISVFKKEALKGLISTDRQDVTLYLYKQNTLVEFGKGDSYELERIIPLMVSHIFDENVRIYKNYHRGADLNIVKDVDFTKLRINL